MKWNTQQKKKKMQNKIAVTENALQGTLHHSRQRGVKVEKARTAQSLAHRGSAAQDTYSDGGEGSEGA